MRKATKWTGDAASGWSFELHDRVSDEGWQDILDQMKRPPQHGHYPLASSGYREGSAHIAFVGDLPLEYRTSRSGREYFTGGDFTSDAHACALIFAPERDELQAEKAWFLPDIAARASETQQAVRASLKKAPIIESATRCSIHLPPTFPHWSIRSSCATFPAACAPSATHYWVWGWDTMMASDATMLGGKRQVRA